MFFIYERKMLVQNVCIFNLLACLKYYAKLLMQTYKMETDTVMKNDKCLDYRYYRAVRHKSIICFISYVE